MSDFERLAIWYVAVLLVGFVAVAVESRRARARTCDACGKPLTYFVEFPADGVRLELCAGCAGEAAAFAQHGDDATTTVDWRDVRRKALERA